MIVINAFPPNIEKILKRFPTVKYNLNVIFTYGHAIYAPHGGTIDKPLQFHEATHSLQQDELGAEKWWEKYLEDDEFRLSQEVEAYRNQLNTLKTMVKDRNTVAKYLHSLAVDLSSDIYGNMISYEDAVKAIRG